MKISSLPLLISSTSENFNPFSIHFKLEKEKEKNDDILTKKLNAHNDDTEAINYESCDWSSIPWKYFIRKKEESAHYL